MFDAKKNLEAFGRALGNEKNLLKTVAEAMENVKSNDASQLAKMIETARRRGDDKAVSALRFLIGKVWVGAKIETPEKKPVVVKIKGAEYSADALALIIAGGAEGLALRGPAIRKRFKAEAETEEPTAEEPTAEEPTAETETAPEPAPEAEAEPTDWLAFVAKLSPTDREALSAALIEVASIEALAA